MRGDVGGVGDSGHGGGGKVGAAGDLEVERGVKAERVILTGCGVN